MIKVWPWVATPHKHWLFVKAPQIEPPLAYHRFQSLSKKTPENFTCNSSPVSGFLRLLNTALFVDLPSFAT